MLQYFGINLYSRVFQIGKIVDNTKFICDKDVFEKINNSKLRCIDKSKEQQMINAIDYAKSRGDTLGGGFEVLIYGVPIGLGSCMHYDKKLDAKLSLALMSIQGIKAVEIGEGLKISKQKGSKVHDTIHYSKDRGYYHKTNNAGGIEGGMSNGETIILRAYMKPIPTLGNPLPSVNIDTKEAVPASVVRSDVCGVPAASIVGKSAAAWEIACSMKEKFGGDSIEEMVGNYERYIERIKK